MATDEFGNKVEFGFVPDGSRYRYDSGSGLPGEPSDWKQYDTWQDAWYFGVWVNLKTWQVFTYAEGDTTLVTCPTADHLRAELERMGKFYGPPPPAAKSIDADGKMTEYFDERPSLG